MHKIKYMQNYLRETKWLPGEIGYIQVNGISLFKKKKICQQKEAVCMKYIKKKWDLESQKGWNDPELVVNRKLRLCSIQGQPHSLSLLCLPRWVLEVLFALYHLAPRPQKILHHRKL